MQAKPGNHRLALSSLKSTRLATVTHYSYHGQHGNQAAFKTAYREISG